MEPFDRMDQSYDAFTRFWTDLSSRMASSGIANPFAQTTSEEAQRQARQAFFDAWAKYCDDFLRSPQFLDLMRQSMDNALTFRKQVNDFLTRSLNEMQVPSRTDADSLAESIRTFEQRVLGALEQLSARVAVLEQKAGGTAGGRPSDRAAGKGHKS